MIQNIHLENLESLLPSIEELSKFCGKWQKDIALEPIAIKKLQQLVIATSAGASTRIEGAKLNNKEALKLILEKKNLFESRSASEVLGYSKAFELVLDSKYNHGKILSQKLIKELHTTLMQFSSDRGIGKYRFIEVNVTDGRDGILLICALPDLIPEFMKNAIKRLVQGWRNNSRSKIILIAEFIAEFLSIHPFEDGNGRCARLLTILLLRMAGHNYLEYTSLEAQIEKFKIQYYLDLNKTQKTGILDNWLKFTIMTLREAQLSLEDNLNRFAPGLKNGTTYLTKEILDIFKVQETCTASEIVKLTKKSPAGVRKVLSTLVKKKILKAFGVNRGRYYSAIL